MIPCKRCNGCGLIANDSEGSPWSEWADLKPPSDIAVRMGLVKPIPCPDCLDDQQVFCPVCNAVFTAPKPREDDSPTSVIDSTLEMARFENILNHHMMQHLPAEWMPKLVAAQKNSCDHKEVGGYVIADSDVHPVRLWCRDIYETVDEALAEMQEENGASNIRIYALTRLPVVKS